MDKAYSTYRIQVVSRERVRVDKRNSQNQSISDEPPRNLRYQEKIELITGLVKKARDNQLNKAEPIKELGEALFDLLFDDAGARDFINFYDEVVQQKKQFLRVELDIDEEIMPELAALPWEFMSLPARFNREIWLATDPHVIFSRHRALLTEPVVIQLGKDEKLRIALVVSAPPGMEFDYQPVVEVLQTLVKEQADLIELLPVLEQADRKSINEILALKPHIFHFIGHGQLEDEQGREVGQLALVDRQLEDAEWIDANEFSRLFAQHRPGIVVLQACEGGALSASQAFAGVASRVVQQNISVVVAMQYLVRINIANKFTCRFYERLAEGYPVDIAAQQGRLAIALEPPHYKRRDFVTPVIFMRGQDGYLFQRSEVDNEPEASGERALLLAELESIKGKNTPITGIEGEELSEVDAIARLKNIETEGGSVHGIKVGKAEGSSLKTQMHLKKGENTTVGGTHINDA